MNRREVLRNAALVVGGSMLSGITMSVLFDSCSTPATKGGKYVFSQPEQDVVTELANVIIPDTSCPGAKAAGVGPFITMMLNDCYPADVQQDFAKGLKYFSKSVKKQFGKEFVSLSPQDKIKAVGQLRDQAIAEKGNGDKTSGKQRPSNFFVVARDLTIMGYFTSEIGATQATEYIPIPGRYNGCVEMKPDQKLWAEN